MKPICQTALALSAAAVFCSCASQDSKELTGRAPYYYSQNHPGISTGSVSPSTEPAEGPWPRTIVAGPTTNLIYEPQADFWDGRQITARDAMSVQSAGQPWPTYGVVTLRAITLVDKARRTVALENIEIVGGYFPSAQPNAQDYLAQVRQTFPKQLAGLSLDRLQANFVPGQSVKTPAQPLNNVPPKLIVSEKPAILVLIDGPPAYRPVKGTDLQQVINTRVLLLQDQAGQFYLHVLNSYLQAASLEGPWHVAQRAPSGAAQAEIQATNSISAVDLLAGTTDVSTNAPPELNDASAPAVYVSTQPAELLLFDGQPNFVPISGTHLLYAANTTGNVFKLLSDQQTYVLLSGRWFRGPSLAGPWQFVPADRLPRDFADIPDNNPKENVKASVAGTPQAAEALLANSIPNSTAVPRTTQMQNPQIDGPPQLQPIAGTSLFYVVNSGTPIIKVDENSWYACQNGVWFLASSLDGPWTMATSVPSAIYSIPPSSPLHYLTYVQVYGTGPEVVYEGYTPGYWGTEVEDGVVVYGTGYYYPPWVGSYWYGWPCTWGFGWGPCWTPWDDWCFDFGFGWGCGFGRFGWWRCHPPFPWCGPGRFRAHEGRSFAWRRTDSASTAGSLYVRSSSFARATGLSRPGTSGLTKDYARAYNSRTGVLAAGQRTSMENLRGGGSGRMSAPDFVAPRNAATFGKTEFARGTSTSAVGPFGRPGSMGNSAASRPTGYYGGGSRSPGYGGRSYSRGFGGASHSGGGGHGGGGHGGGCGHGGGGGHGGSGR